MTADAEPPVPGPDPLTRPLSHSGSSHHTVDMAVDSMLSNLRDVTHIGAVPVLGLYTIISIAADILSTVSTLLYTDRAFIDLAFNASGLVCAVTMECQNILNKGRNVPWGFESTLSTLAENLAEIKGFGEKKRHRSFSSRIMCFLPDQLHCAHYRTQLQHCLDTFDTLSKISIRSSVNIIVRDVERAAEEEERKLKSASSSSMRSRSSPRRRRRSSSHDSESFADKNEKEREREKSLNERGGSSSAESSDSTSTPNSPPHSPSNSHSPSKSPSHTASSSSTTSPSISPPPTLSPLPLAFRTLVQGSQPDLVLVRARGSVSDIPSLGIFKTTSEGGSNEKRRSTA